MFVWRNNMPHLWLVLSPGLPDAHNAPAPVEGSLNPAPLLHQDELAGVLGPPLLTHMAKQCPNHLDKQNDYRTVRILGENRAFIALSQLSGQQQPITVENIYNTVLS